MVRALATFVVLAAALLAGCGTVRVVSDYDEVIDRGIMEFSEQLHTQVNNMADVGGKPEGTYEANLKTYNALESKLDVLISRASAMSEGKACKLQEKVFQKISEALKNNVPAGLQQGSDATSATANSCNAHLLRLVKDQLDGIREIHQKTDKCNGISCIRRATAATALAITDQSITAVSVVEAAKRSEK